MANVTNNVNIIYGSIINYKRVIDNILVAELYRIAHGFDIEVVLKAILGKILGLAISLILCTDAKFLDDCLVKLGIT